MIVPSGLLLVKVDVLGQGLRKSHDLGCELVFIANQDLWQFRLDGCVMGDAGHESDAAATISQRPRIACSHHPCWILHNGSHQPAGVPDNRCLVHVDEQGRSSQRRCGQCKIHPLEKDQSLRGSKNGAVTRPQKVTRILFLGIYSVFIITQIAEKIGLNLSPPGRPEYRPFKLIQNYI